MAAVCWNTQLFKRFVPVLMGHSVMAWVAGVNRSVMAMEFAVKMRFVQGLIFGVRLVESLTLLEEWAA